MKAEDASREVQKKCGNRKKVQGVGVMGKRLIMYGAQCQYPTQKCLKNNKQGMCCCECTEECDERCLNVPEKCGRYDTEA